MAKEVDPEGNRTICVLTKVTFFFKYNYFYQINFFKKNTIIYNNLF